ncbi:unnamed protein product [Closterium sp. NIES-64]|nr:unnamed protein product [Closterium sp. NIES-64]
MLPLCSPPIPVSPWLLPGAPRPAAHALAGDAAGAEAGLVCTTPHPMLLPSSPRAICVSLRLNPAAISPSVHALAADTAGAGARVVPPAPRRMRWQVTVLERERGRSVMNGQEVARVAHALFPEMPLLIARVGKASASDHALLLKNTLVLISLHGTPLTTALFMPRGSVVVELFPYKFLSTLYKKIAMRSGVHYLAWRNIHDISAFFRNSCMKDGGFTHLPEEQCWNIHECEGSSSASSSDTHSSTAKALGARSAAIVLARSEHAVSLSVNPWCEGRGGSKSSVGTRGAAKGAMEAGAKRPEDVSLPKATMSRLIKEMLPRDVRVSKDTQDLLMDCCLEFINLISSEANEMCSKEDKRTIAPEHVLQALESLGFSSYLAEVQAAYDQHKSETLESPRALGRSSSSKASGAVGMSEEEAIAEQQKMFAEARAAMLNLQRPPS